MAPFCPTFTHRSVFRCWNGLVSHWQITTSSFVCIRNQISCSYFINSDKLTPDKPAILSHLGGGISPRRWWELTPGARDASFRSPCYCVRLGPRLRRESLPLMENYCLPPRTYDCVEYGSAYLDLCTRQNEALCPTESYFGIVISTEVDSD